VIRTVAWALPVFFVLGCQRSPTTPAPADRPPANQGVEQPKPLSAADARRPSLADEPRSFQIEGRRIRLTEDASACALTHAVADQPEQVVKLSLSPPCHLMMWKDSPPRREANRTSTNAEADSDGDPVGQAGDPMAWRYPTADNATVVAIIGDPVPERMRDDVYRRWIDQGFHCAGSIQGVALRKESVSATPPRSQVGVFCVEAGLDQKEFWLLAHPPSP